MKRKIWGGEKNRQRKLFPAAGTEYREKRSPCARTQKSLRKGGEAGRGQLMQGLMGLLKDPVL